MQDKIENWLETKLAKRANSHGPVEIYAEEVELWAFDILDIFYGDNDNPPSQESTVRGINQWLAIKGK